MAGMARVHLRFSGGAPSAREVVAEAQRIGGVTLVATECVESGQTVVKFQAFPEGYVTIRQRSSEPELSIADTSLIAPALYRLLWQASNRLGAEPACSDSLPLPLSEDFVHRYNVRYRWLAYIGSVALILLPIAVLAGLASLVRWVVSAVLP